VDFEFDPEKSAANLAKHGIDFEAAQALWLDDRRVVLPARSETEPRFAVTGLIDRRHWTAFVTIRASAVRIISVRRSRREEVEEYERKISDR
jgi:uncharacterized protein